jgi:tetratricopeptide (TPR) repeat protein
MLVRAVRPVFLIGWGVALLLAQDRNNVEQLITRHLAAAQQSERVQDYAGASSQYEEILKLRPDLSLIHQSLAVTYHLRNRYLQAIAEFQRAIALDPSLWGANLFLGMDYYKSNQFPAAIAPLRKSISLNPMAAEPEARFWLGMTYSALGQDQDAVKELRRDLELRPKDVEVLYRLTRTYDQCASTLFERLGRVDPGGAAVSLLEAERLKAENRHDLARLEYRRALWLRPDLVGVAPALTPNQAPANDGSRPDSDWAISERDARASLELAALFSSVSDTKSAASILQHLASQRAADSQASEIIVTARKELDAVAAVQIPVRDSVSADTREGIELFRTAKFKEAQGPLARAAAQGSPNRSLQILLARAYLETGDFLASESVLKELSATNPDDVDALHLLGRNYKQQAETTLEQMIAIDPASYGVHELLGRQHEEHTDYDAAIKEYQAALSKRPDLAGVRYEIGNVYRKMRQYEQAEHWLSEELARNPYHGFAHYRLGAIYTELEKPDQAIPQLEEALRLHPELTEARLDLGRAYAAKGRYADAIGNLQQVAKAAPDNDRVHYLLSNAYLKEGRSTEAQEELTTYQRLTRERLQRTQQGIRDVSHSLDQQ